MKLLLNDSQSPVPTSPPRPTKKEKGKRKCATYKSFILEVPEKHGCYPKYKYPEFLRKQVKAKKGESAVLSTAFPCASLDGAFSRVNGQRQGEEKEN